MMKAPAAGIAIAVALTAGALGVWKGSFAAADGDSFGYVSEADLIAHGSLRVEQQFVRTMPWPFADWSFAPVGYRPARSRGVIVPTYPPGLPLVMAVFQRLAGARAVFYVVPLLGALCVWLTSELGSAVHSRPCGALAAVMLFASPTFLSQLMLPLSDVPATAWWTWVLVLALREKTPLAALGAGAAAAMAILTRPNLVPLAAVVGSLMLWRIFHRTAAPRPARRLALFAAPVVAGCLSVAAVNQYLYGSAWSSGYEPFRALYDLANAVPNLDRYPRWLMQTQTPFICLALAAPWFARAGGRRAAPPPLTAAHVVVLLSFGAVVFLSYLFYVSFGRDDWTYLRFLLPAYPGLLVLAIASTIELARRAFARGRAAVPVAVCVCVAVSAGLAHIADRRGVFNARAAERRYIDVGRHIAALLPTNSVFIANLHAGSIRYYSGRLTVQYEWLQPRWLDQAVKEIDARGYHSFFALEEEEEAPFRQRFGQLNELGRLDWPPAAERRDPVRVRIYDPADRDRYRRGERVVTYSIDRARDR